MMDILGGGLVRKDGRVEWDEVPRVVAFAIGDMILTEHSGYVYTLPFDLRRKLLPNFDEEEFLSHFDDKNSDDEILLDDLREYLKSLFSVDEVTDVALKICEDRVPAYFE